MAAVTAFEAGLSAYRAQDWDAADVSFKSVLDKTPGDGPSLVYLDRIAHLRTETPAETWDGVWTFETK